MILMVSVQDLEEAMQALRGGADIVDVKNLQEALVGSAHPRTVKDVRDAVPKTGTPASRWAWSRTRWVPSPWRYTRPARWTPRPSRSAS